MQKIVIITTGGTIAMRKDEISGRLVPAVDGEALIAAVPGLSELAAIVVVEFANLPSCHITPAMMLELAEKVDVCAAQEDVSGIVVTHGTDTLEETAYFLSLACRTEKAVILTGAMRGADEAGADGPANLLSAVKVAVAPEAGGRSVLVVMNDEIHAAAEVTKTHTVSCSTFRSPEWGPVGQVYADRVVFNRRCENLLKIPAEKLDCDVELLKVTAGMSGFFLHCAADKPVSGVVVEALGCGNVPPAVAAGIAYVRSKGIPVVLASRTGGGRVVPLYAYPGSAGAMKPLGLLSAGALSGPKARLKLMLALGMTDSTVKLKHYFENFNDK